MIGGDDDESWMNKRDFQNSKTNNTWSADT